ncbi:unnamed protein product [Rhizopus stolonifer]
MQSTTVYYTSSYSSHSKTNSQNTPGNNILPESLKIPYGNGTKRKQVKNACTNCQKACKKCDDARPCPRCIKNNVSDSCVDSIRKERKRGIKRGPYKRRQQKQDEQNEQPLSTFYSTTQPSDNGATPTKDQTIPQQQYILPHYSTYLPSAKNLESNEKKNAENHAYDQQYLLQTIQNEVNSESNTSINNSSAKDEDEQLRFDRLTQLCSEALKGNKEK